MHATLPKKFQTQVEVSKAHIVTLRVVILLLALLCSGALYGWTTAPQQITVHIPPQFQSGTQQGVDHVPPPNVYTFAAYIWQQMHRWPANGEDDYPANMFRLQSFLTPRFYDWLEADFQGKARRGELRGKVRGISEIPGRHYEPSRVVPVGDGAWIVWLDVEIKEWVNDLVTKDVRLRYPLRVVRFDVDRERNPWGLALDGFPEGQTPERLPDADVKDN